MEGKKKRWREAEGQYGEIKLGQEKIVEKKG